jgi:CBS domain-containing protein
MSVPLVSGVLPVTKRKVASPTRRLHSLTARDLMTQPVAYVMAETPVKSVAALMLERAISAVPVLDETGRLIGIVSEGDLIRRRAEGGRRSWWLDLFGDDPAQSNEILAYLQRHSLRAKDVMTRDPVTVTEETPIVRIAELLDEHRIKRVPVMRAGRMVGIVSRANLLRSLAAEPRQGISSC